MRPTLEAITSGDRSSLYQCEAITSTGASPDISPAGVGSDDGQRMLWSPEHLPQDEVDIPRLLRRIHAYAQAYNITPGGVRQMAALLATPLAIRLLRLPTERLHDFLVLDAYKPRMHRMYDKYMTGVTADFALIVRHAPKAADPATLPTDHPELWQRFEAAAAAISRTEPYSQHVAQALRTQFGMELPQSLLDRCHRDGVAPVRWQTCHSGGPVGEGRVAVASGPLISSSLVETPLMQAFQELTVAAQVVGQSAALHDTTRHNRCLVAAQLEAAAGCASPSSLPPLDRTERLANSLARLVVTVDRINGLHHGCRVALFAGRRSSDMLFLVLQNLYCAAHLAGYLGTSSLFAAAVVGREWARMGVPERERWGGPGRLVGTHAHEQVSAVQQLLAPYDAEAGRRCGRPHGVPVTPMLSHLLFLAANGAGGAGGAGATALADTFTTAAFLAVARAAEVPAAFRRDVEVAHGWVVPQHARCFDLFRIWRVDSGRYEEVAEAIMAAWESRCSELRAEGRRELPRPQLMHSNLESVEHIAQVCKLGPRVRPNTLAFGTLADGFFPFLDPAEDQSDLNGAAADPSYGTAATLAPCTPSSRPDGVAPLSPLPTPHGQTAASPAAAATGAPTARDVDEPRASTPQPRPRPVVELASVVMKLVQARPPRPVPPPRRPEAAAPPQAAAAQPSPSPALPACAVKLGDGDSGKAQVDPRLDRDSAQATLAAAREMALGSASPPLDSAAVSAVLAEAYDAVTHGGVLMAEGTRGSAVSM